MGTGREGRVKENKTKIKLIRMVRCCWMLSLFIVVVSAFLACESMAMVQPRRPTNNNNNMSINHRDHNSNSNNDQQNLQPLRSEQTTLSSSGHSNSRRSFLSISAAIGSSGTVMNAIKGSISTSSSNISSSINTNVANAAWFWDAPKETTYDEFIELLKSDQLSQVVFKADGYSLICVDVAGYIRPVRALDNDPSLLMTLYKRKVDVTMEELPPRAMNTVDWFRDLVGDELDEDEKYKYRGYKTFRMNTQGEIPSSLLTNFSGR